MPTIWIGDTDRNALFDADGFRRTGSAAASDAIGKSGGMASHLRPVWPSPAFAGRALPVVSSPNDNLLPYAALRHVRRGDVLVIATGGAQVHTALLGSTILGHLRNLGVAGVVTDAYVRDVAEIEALGVPLFAAGIHSAAPTKSGRGAIGMPVAIGGVVIATGDVIVADRDGITCVPMEQIDEALAELSAVAAKEKQAASAIAAQATEPGWLADALAGSTIHTSSLRQS